MYRYPKTTLAGILFLQTLMLTSCRQNTAAPPPAAIQAFAETPQYPTTTPQEQATLHTDTTYQYEYRTGKSGAYKYNYDVIGKDPSGQKIVGNVNMYGKYGVGTLLDINGKETDVKLEWVGHGELKAQDTDGNIWELVVE